MKNADLHELYEDYGFLQEIPLIGASYTSLPEGELDIGRFTRNLPAFRAPTEQVKYKKKKLLIEPINPYGNRTPSNYISCLKKLIADGFEIYTLHNGRIVRLDNQNVGRVVFGVDHTPSNELLKMAREKLKCPYDELTLIPSNRLDQLQQAIKSQEISSIDLWYIKNIRGSSSFQVVKYEGEELLIEHYDDINFEDLDKLIEKFKNDYPQSRVTQQQIKMIITSLTKGHCLPQTDEVRDLFIKTRPKTDEEEMEPGEIPEFPKLEYLEIDKPKISMRTILEILNKSPKLSNLVVKNIDEIGYWDPEIENDLEALEHIEFHLSNFNSDHLFSKIVEKCPSLKSCFFEGKNISNVIDELTKSQRPLERATFIQDSGNKYIELGKFLQNNPKLAYLYLQNLDIDDKATVLPDTYCSNLEEIKLASCDFLAEFFAKFLNHSSKLKSLVLQSVNLYDSKETNIVLPALEELTITKGNLYKDFFDGLQAPKLKTLTLQDSRGFDEIESFDCDLPTLQVLSVKNSDINSTQLSCIMKDARYLKCLTIEDCKYLNNSSDVELPEMESLRRLELHNTTIDGNYLLSLLTKAPNLPRVEFSNLNIVNADKELQQKIKERLNSLGCWDVAYNFNRQEEKRLKANQSEATDADTEYKKSNFQVNKYFVPAISSTQEPVVNYYRINTYGKVEVCQTSCSASNVFTLANDNNLELEECTLNFLGSEQAIREKISTPEFQLRNVYHGKIKLSLDSDWQALPSLSAHETITDIHTSTSQENIEIKYSKRDNLYYIRKKSGEPQEITVNYLLKCDTERSAQIPEQVKALVDYCSSFSAGKLSLGANPTGVEYLQALIEQKHGACRHRSLVFFELMQNPDLRKHLPADIQKQIEGLGTYPVRIVNNECHSFAEVCVDGCWTSLNLGGYTANLTIKDLHKDTTSKPTSATLTPKGEQTPKVKKEVTNYFAREKTEKTETALEFIQQVMQKNKCLMQVSSRTSPKLAHHLAQHCINTSQNHFVVSSPEDLVCQRPYCDVGDDGKAHIDRGPGGPLYRFLNDGQESHVIIIDFNNFPARKLASCNSLLDEPPSIDGIPLPKGTKVYGLIDPNTYQDPSFYSRFAGNVRQFNEYQIKLDFPELFSKVTDNDDDQSILKIDLHGQSLWEPELIGSFSIGQDSLTYNKSTLIKALEGPNPPTTIRLINPPNDPNLGQFLLQAKQRGYIEYENRRVSINPNTKIEIYEGVTITPDKFIEDINQSNPSKEAIILNSTSLSKFFKQYTHDDTNDSLLTSPGIIEEHKNSTLDIYLTQSLNLSDWSKLQEICLLHEVKLKISVAPGVSLPKELRHTLVEPDLSIGVFRADNLNPANIIVTSSEPDVSVQELLDGNPGAIHIDVSEFNAGTLVEKVDANFDSRSLKFKFKKEAGALLKALDANKTVILSGNLNPGLKHKLESLLQERQRENNPKGKLIIINDQSDKFSFAGLGELVSHQVTEEEKSRLVVEFAEKLLENNSKVKIEELALDNINKSRPLSEQFAIIRKRFIARAQDKSVSQEDTPWDGMETLPKSANLTHDFDLDKAHEIAKRVDEQRLTMVQSALSQSPFVFLAGKTGVGKTSFVEKVCSKEGRRLYVGTAHDLHVLQDTLEQWARASSDKENVLFIDEANITELNWSIFESLFNSPPGIVVNNQYIELSNNHKVIFAGNPVSYSADRSLPSFFQRHGGSVIFDPLVPEYIYERMLKSLFNNAEEAKAVCSPIFEVLSTVQTYDDTAVLLTPRELKMIAQLTVNYCRNHSDVDKSQIAKYYAYRIALPFIPEDKVAEFKKKFACDIERGEKLPIEGHDELAITASNRPIAELIDDFLTLRQGLSSEGTQTTALGGIVIEGEPGLGKTSLAVNSLLQKGFNRKEYSEGAPIEKASDKFYVISASLRPEVKEKILLRAFEEGAVVVYDEINASASMEKLFNRLLMGEGLDGKPPKHKGFMLIATQNPVTMAGRLEASSAMKHRLHYCTLPPYGKDELLQITDKMGLPRETSEELVEQYIKKSRVDNTLCTRDFINKAKELVKAKEASEHRIIAAPREPPAKDKTYTDFRIFARSGKKGDKYAQSVRFEDGVISKINFEEDKREKRLTGTKRQLLGEKKGLKVCSPTGHRYRLNNDSEKKITRAVLTKKGLPEDERESKDDKHRQKLAVTMFNMIDNILAGSKVVNVNTRSAFLAQIAKSYIEFIKEESQDKISGYEITGVDLTDPKNAEDIQTANTIFDKISSKHLSSKDANERQTRMRSATQEMRSSLGEQDLDNGDKPSP